MKLTGHLCFRHVSRGCRPRASITWSTASSSPRDFVPGKKTGCVPRPGCRAKRSWRRSIRTESPSRPLIQGAHRQACRCDVPRSRCSSSALPGRPASAPGSDVLDPHPSRSVSSGARRPSIETPAHSPGPGTQRCPSSRWISSAAGGTLLVGTDPTGGGGGDRRVLEPSGSRAPRRSGAHARSKRSTSARSTAPRSSA